LLATLLILGMCVLSYAAAMYVAESEVRVKRLGKDYLVREKKRQHNIFSNVDNGDDNVMNGSHVQHLDAIPSEQTSLVPHIHSKDCVSDSNNDVTIEVSELVELLLGPFHGALYKFSLLACSYICLLAFTQIFRSSLEAMLLNGDVNEENATFISASVFALVVVPLSCMELDEQVSVQTAMAMIRFLALSVMIGGSIIALYLDPYGGVIDEHTSSSAPQTPYFAPAVEGEMSYTVMFSGFGLAFSTGLFSFLPPHPVPGLLKPLDAKKRRRANLTFLTALFTACGFYIILGSSAAIYFGSKLRSNVNLNFADFASGLIDDESVSPTILRICQVASNFVVLYPALDILSIFPLIAIALGNNLAASFPQLHDFAKQHQPGSERIATIFWRLLSSIPPIIVSLWATDLSFSLQLGAISGIEISYFAPALLQRSSCAFITKRFGKDKTNTVYSGWHSNRGFVTSVLVFAMISLCIVLVQIWGVWTEMSDKS